MARLNGWTCSRMLPRHLICGDFFAAGLLQGDFDGTEGGRREAGELRGKNYNSLGSMHYQASRPCRCARPHSLVSRILGSQLFWPSWQNLLFPLGFQMSMKGS